MDNVKDKKYYLDLMLGDSLFINNHVKNISYRDFCTNELLVSALCFKLIQISENAKELSNLVDKSYIEIPLSQICALRNRIVHDYGSINLGTLFSIVSEDIPELIETITKIKSKSM